MDFISAIIWWFVGSVVLTIVVYAIYFSTLNNKEKEKTAIANKLMESKGYHVTHRIGILAIDENNKKWPIDGCGSIYDYSDLIDVKVSELGNSLQISHMTIDIVTKDPNKPLLKIDLYHGNPIKVGEFTYNSVTLLKNKYISQLTRMKSQGDSKNVYQPPKADESEPIEPIESIDTPTKVAGVTKLNDKGIAIQTLLPTLNNDTDMILSRDKDNPYDKNAIKVIADYMHIGYIKAGLAATIAPIMDSGKPVYVESLEVTGGNGKTYGCNIRVYT